MDKCELYDLCCEADEIDSKAYAALCEQELSEEDFFTAVKEIVNQ